MNGITLFYAFHSAVLHGTGDENRIGGRPTFLSFMLHSFLHILQQCFANQPGHVYNGSIDEEFSVLKTGPKSIRN